MNKDVMDKHVMNKHGIKRGLGWGLVVGALIGIGTIDTPFISVGQAEAVVGRPLTPVSVAGVSRRTTRRTVYRHGAYGGYGYGGYGYGAAAGVAVGAAAVGAATLAALPSGCSSYSYTWGPYYGCHGTYYRPVYDGPDVTYVQIEKPD